MKQRKSFRTKLEIALEPSTITKLLALRENCPKNTVKFTPIKGAVGAVLARKNFNEA